MKLKEIHRTSTFAWSPASAASLPLLATGSVAGALDSSFSNEAKLEIWAPDFLDKDEFDLGIEGDERNGPKASVGDSARFNRLAWGYVQGNRTKGVIAAGMENGELTLWDPEKILAGQEQSESLILRNTTHTGPIRGLDFNPIQTNLLASGGINGEVYIWDLKDPSKPYSPTPGTRSTKLDEMTSVAWNNQVQYVLAGASSTGYTVVWDLRGKREVVALAYAGGAGTGQGGSGLAVGGRRGMSDIAWHPDNATRLVTASEDDSSPVVMVWDLRNARAPEKILTGHDKGVLSLSWCKQDADLLLSCGKDNRALAWNPQTSEIIGELPSADNWGFQVDWCPRNPDLLATAFFDGTVGIHSIQSTNEPAAASGTGTLANDDPSGSDVFDVPGFSRTSQGSTLSLQQPPKWLRRPVSSSFGFGGKLLTVANLPNATGKNQSSIVHLRNVVTENDLVERVRKLRDAVSEKTLAGFAEEKVAEDGEAWKALKTLFRADSDSREELIALLGFSKEDIKERVAEAIKAIKAKETSSTTEEEPLVADRETVVSFVEPEPEPAAESEEDESKTPSERSVSVSSPVDGESTTTVPSLFGDENAPGTPQVDNAADFFSTIGLTGSNTNEDTIVVPHHNYPIDSSVAATAGSRPSSVFNDREEHFRIYPVDENDSDRLVTKALVLGDFESAVSLCLESERYADAILLAAKGGPALLQKTQKAYFEKQTALKPYLRLFQSIVGNDLADIVQNAELHEWQEIFVVLCTFASAEEFAGLTEQLGMRLEFQAALLRANDEDASEYVKNATLTYLAAGRLERLVNIWIEELSEEEKARVSDVNATGSRYAAHGHALQSFIEKVTVFRSAIRYVDVDIDRANDTYKLAGLYDRYYEYADLLSTQGLVKEAVSFLKLTPEEYRGTNGVDLTVGKDRLLKAASVAPEKAVYPNKAAPAANAKVPASNYVAAPSSYGAYNGSAAPRSQPAMPASSAYAPSNANTAYPAANSGYANANAGPYTTGHSNSGYQAPANPNYNAGNSNPNAGGYAPTNPSYAPANTNSGGYQPAPSGYQPSNPGYQPNNSGYQPSNSGGYQPSLTQPPHMRAPAPAQAAPVPPPPRAGTSGPPPPPAQAAAPPPKRVVQDAGGWNDAPSTLADRRTPNSLQLNKPAAITSPFPNAGLTSPGYASPGLASPGNFAQMQASPGVGGPPRPGSVVQRAPPPPQAGRGMPPPARMMSPPNNQAPSRQGTPGFTAMGRPPPPAGLGGNFAHGQPQGPAGFTSPGYAPAAQGQYAPPGPQQNQPQQQQQPGPYGPPAGQQQQQQPGPYGPPAGQQQQQQPGPYGPPPVQQQQHQQQQIQPPLNVPPPKAAPPPRQTGPPPPKYPAGDRSHIPENARPSYEVLAGLLSQLRETTPPQQKRQIEDLERRVNPLFDALNCETLSAGVVEHLGVLTNAMASHDRAAALAIHVDLLTRGSQTDDIGLWMSGVKQLIMRL